MTFHISIPHTLVSPASGFYPGKTALPSTQNGSLPCPSQLTLIGGIVKCHQAGSVFPELKNAYPAKVYFESGKAVQRQI
jgi:hypothetical protein